MGNLTRVLMCFLFLQKKKAPTRPSGFLQSDGRGRVESYEALRLSWKGRANRPTKSVVSPSLIAPAIGQVLREGPHSGHYGRHSFSQDFKTHPLCPMPRGYLVLRLSPAAVTRFLVAVG